jgi:peroxiredoxin
MCFNKVYPVLLCFLALACGTGGIQNDLFPSGSDERSLAVSGSVGSQVGQIAPVYSKSNTSGNTVTLADDLNSSDALVLYFTMWCPICDSHMSHLRANVKTLYPTVQFNLVDYVSGTVSLARQSQISSGYGDFQTLVDDDGSLISDFHATMGSVVVIGPSGNVLMNENYKNGQRLLEVLSHL